MRVSLDVWRRLNGIPKYCARCPKELAGKVYRIRETREVLCKNCYHQHLQDRSKAAGKVC